MMVETWLRFPFRQQQGMAVFVDRWFIEDDGVPDNQYVSEIPVERLVLNLRHMTTPVRGFDDSKSFPRRTYELLFKHEEYMSECRNRSAWAVTVGRL